MTGLLFVHGTGVRGESYYRTLDLIARKAKRYLPGYLVHGCQWGDAFGAKLNHGGDSIPDYTQTGDSKPAVEDSERARWSLLSQYPLLELRMAPQETVIGELPGVWIWNQVKALRENVEIRNLLDGCEVAPAWPGLIDGIVRDDAWKTVVESISQEPPAASPKVARAITAAFLIALREQGYPGLAGSQRDQMHSMMLQPLGGPPLGIEDWFLARLTKFGARRRGAMHDATSPAVGDILRYQARGQEIRNFIAERVKETSATVILAHSLGGIASVDYLASAQRPISHVVTAGSQGPFFYEIDALVSRAYGSGLPEFFPKNWLNFYDPSDFLSFRAGKIFRFAYDKQVDNGQPFPESHSAYWNNEDQVWPEIAKFLPESL